MKDLKTTQEVRNALCAIEDEARARRNNVNIHQPELIAPYDLIARLAQIVREDIVG